MNEIKRPVVSLLLENEAGALSRVVGLFSARGFNIDCLNVAPTQDRTISRLTLVTHCDDQLIEQINKQLNKLVEVIKLVNLSDAEFIDREMMLVKVQADAHSRSAYLQLNDAFRGRVVAISPSTVIFEISGSQRKLDAFIGALEPEAIVELSRTGVTGLASTGSGKCLLLTD